MTPADCHSESNDPEVVTQFAWIPEEMLLSLLKRDVTIELRSASDPCEVQSLS